MRYDPIDPRLFVHNRAELARLLAANSFAVVNANDIMPTSADGAHPFVQNPDLFYLSGIDQEETLLVIYPEARDPRQREMLFLKETDERIATWEGAKLTKEEGRRISGISSVHWTREFESLFRQLACEADCIYLNSNEHLRAEVRVETRDMRFAAWCRKAFPLHGYRRLAPLMQRLRAVKSPQEVALMRRAGRITGEVFAQLLKFIRPGVWEYEIEAEIVHGFLRRRSRRPAYTSIVASGPNSCVLHYVQKSRQCRKGELVLLDFGAEYANYAADMTRTVPVSGRFNPRQRQVYDAVLRVQRAAMAMLVPGNTLKAYHEEVGRIMEKELIGLGLLDAGEVKNQDENAPLYKQYFMHGTSHHLGLDVHDVADRHRPFEAGMVLTCEPGIYISAESLGVRIETDVLIGDDGPVDLLAQVPVEADDIEALMRM